MCFRSCFVDFFFIFGCCVFAGAPTSLLAAASSSSSHANMAPATPRIDASPPVSLSVGSMALLANLQRDLQVYSARLTALEEQNRSLKDSNFNRRLYQRVLMWVLQPLIARQDTGFQFKTADDRVFTLFPVLSLSDNTSWGTNDNYLCVFHSA